MRYFETKFLEDADRFLASLEAKAVEKVIYNIDLAGQTNDPRLFKKLNGDIWEFRIRYAGNQIRCLHFGTKEIESKRLLWQRMAF